MPVYACMFDTPTSKIGGSTISINNPIPLANNAHPHPSTQDLLRQRNGGVSHSSSSSKPYPYGLLSTTSPSFRGAGGIPRSSSTANWGGLMRPLSRLPLCQARPGLAAAADALDRLIASALHGLRAYPWLRLAFLGYLLALHVWAFGLLVFHSQQIEAVHADVGGSAADPAAVVGMN